MLPVFRSWLGERSSTVIVDGVHSRARPLSCSVYQGTVWGPPLWNRFFESARHSINAQGFTESVFADDLNCFRAFEAGVADSDILQELQRCQSSLHFWGHTMRVSFDSSKEGLYILSPRRPLGSSFRILGVTFDTKLTMDACLHEIAGQAHNQVSILLRTRRFHSVADLLRLYKSYVLSYLESGLPAYYHAPRFFLGLLDRVQDRFLDELGMTPVTALRDFSLAPLTTRRDIAMLGFLHRVVNGLAPGPLASLFPRAVARRFPRDVRGESYRHSRQLLDRCDGTQPPCFERSVFGPVYSYNLLPQRLVDIAEVSKFQRELQRAVRYAEASSIQNWQDILSNGCRRLSIRQFQALFCN